MTLPDMPLQGGVLIGLLAAAYLLVVNGLTYAAFGLDKRRAVAGAWRISESTLLSLALIGGWPGAKLAQRNFRHKTRKQPFRSLLNLILPAQISGLVYLAGPWGPPLDGLAAVLTDDLPRALAEMLDPFGHSPDQPPMPRRFGPGS